VESDGVDGALVVGDAVEWCLFIGGPELDCGIFGGCDKCLSVGRKLDVADKVVMSSERILFGSLWEGKETEFAVFVTGDEV
jgi:hypothetical protein